MRLQHLPMNLVERNIVTPLGITLGGYLKGGFKVVFGDANVRWHGRREAEERVLGPFVFGKGVDFLNPRARNSQVNRELAWDLMTEHQLKQGSTTRIHWIKQLIVTGGSVLKHKPRSGPMPS